MWGVPRMFEKTLQRVFYVQKLQKIRVYWYILHEYRWRPKAKGGCQSQVFGITDQGQIKWWRFQEKQYRFFTQQVSSLQQCENLDFFEYTKFCVKSFWVNLATHEDCNFDNFQGSWSTNVFVEFVQNGSFFSKLISCIAIQLGNILDIISLHKFRFEIETAYLTKGF